MDLNEFRTTIYACGQASRTAYYCKHCGRRAGTLINGQGDIRRCDCQASREQAGRPSLDVLARLALRYPSPDIRERARLAIVAHGDH